VQIYLIRHPRPVATQGVCYGRLNVAISADALAQAATQVRRQLDALHDVVFFSSPALRCRLLAQELANPRQLTIVPELAEMDFGSWEGRSWDAVPRHELDAWADDVWGYSPGGAESPAAVAARWCAWSERLKTSAIETAIAVTHAGLIRVALHCCGLLNSSNFSSAAIEHGSVHRVELRSDRVLS
jgi:alpha-ribazole phosphatase